MVILICDTGKLGISDTLRGRVIISFITQWQKSINILCGDIVHIMEQIVWQNNNNRGCDMAK